MRTKDQRSNCVVPCRAVQVADKPQSFGAQLKALRLETFQKMCAMSDRQSSYRLHNTRNVYTCMQDCTRVVDVLFSREARLHASVPIAIVVHLDHYISIGTLPARRFEKSGVEEMEDVVGLDSNDLKEIGLNMAQRNRVVNSPPGDVCPIL